MSCLIHWLLQIYWFILFIRILLSWFRVPYSGPAHTAVGFLNAVTDPVLRPFRNLVPGIPMGGMRLDLSPIILFIILSILLTYIHC